MTTRRVRGWWLLAACVVVAVGGCGGDSGWRSADPWRQMHYCVNEQMLAPHPGATHEGGDEEWPRYFNADIDDYAWAIDICTRLGAGK